MQYQRMPQGSSSYKRQSGDVDACVPAHSTLLHKLDAFVTMVQKSKGDPADILQNVIWQKELYSKLPQLSELEFSVELVRKSEEFIHGYELRRINNIDYTKLISELLEIFRKTSKVLDTLNLQLEKDVEGMSINLSSQVVLQKGHRGYLLKLQSLDKKHNY